MTADMTPVDDRPTVPDAETGTDQAGEPITDAPTADQLAEPLTVAEVETMLTGAGRGLHSLFGDPRVVEHWAFTADEVAGLAPPLTAIANRRPAMLRVVRQSDAANASLVMASYVRRNLRLAADIAELDETAEDEPRVPTVPDENNVA